MLADTERTMIKRWARPRAMTLTGWLFVTLGLLAAASWFGAGYLKPPTVAASVTITAVPDEGDDPTDADLELWQKTHRIMLDNATLHEAIAKRCADLQFVGYRDAGAVAARLQQDLAVDAAQPGRLTLSLVGGHPRETQQLLDIVATTLVAESGAGITELPADAMVLGERHERGRITYATMGPLPIEDHRMKLAGPLFASSALLALLVFSWIVRRLQKATRIMKDVHPPSAIRVT